MSTVKELRSTFEHQAKGSSGDALLERLDEIQTLQGNLHLEAAVLEKEVLQRMGRFRRSSGAERGVIAAGRFDQEAASSSGFGEVDAIATALEQLRGEQDQEQGRIRTTARGFPSREVSPGHTTELPQQVPDDAGYGYSSAEDASTASANIGLGGVAEGPARDE